MGGPHGVMIATNSQEHHQTLLSINMSEQRAGSTSYLLFPNAFSRLQPDRVTTDKHASYPRAIRRILGRQVLHRTNQYLNNRLEQDHRAVKQRYYPMRGFGSFASAARFCPAFDEVRQYFRARSTNQKPLPLAEQRRHFRQRFIALLTCYQAA